MRIKGLVFCTKAAFIGEEVLSCYFTRQDLFCTDAEGSLVPGSGSLELCDQFREDRAQESPWEQLWPQRQGG